jgi:hypothetical protein
MSKRESFCDEARHHLKRTLKGEVWTMGYPQVRLPEGPGSTGPAGSRFDIVRRTSPSRPAAISGSATGGSYCIPLQPEGNSYPKLVNTPSGGTPAAALAPGVGWSRRRSRPGPGGDQPGVRPDQAKGGGGGARGRSSSAWPANRCSPQRTHRVHEQSAREHDRPARSC